MSRIIKLFFVIALILRLSFLVPVSCYSNVSQLEIPVNLSVPLTFKYPVTSSQIATGDTLEVSIAEDVNVGNTLVFKKGAGGVVFVEKSKKGRSWGRGGKIEITSGSVTDVFGNKHPVKLSARATGDSAVSGKILPIVGIVVLWPLAFFGFKKGDDAVIPAGKVIYAFTTSPSSISTSKL